MRRPSPQSRGEPQRAQSFDKILHSLLYFRKLSCNIREEVGFRAGQYKGMVSRRYRAQRQLMRLIPSTTIDAVIDGYVKT